MAVSIIADRKLRSEMVDTDVFVQHRGRITCGRRVVDGR